jgi:hypothetical protein
MGYDKLATSVTGPRMTEAALALLAALSPQQRSRAAFDFPDEIERRSWYYFPAERRGLPLAAMDAAQQKLTHKLLATGLSLPAYAKTVSIIALENVLREVEGPRMRFDRDPSLYFLSFFGEPGGAAPWGWRFEGHHVSLHYTLVEGALAATPSFLGANPAEVRRGGRAVLRPLGEEEDLARDLLASLDPGQKRRALICDVAPADIVTTNLPELAGEVVFDPSRVGLAVREMPPDPRVTAATKLDTPARGLAASEMSKGQRETLGALLRTYLERLPEDAARREIEVIEASGLDDLVFAWAGEERRGRPHYYRLQGETLLIEYDNTQNGANHVHTVWRDRRMDFGADLLRRHYETAHGRR